VKHLVSILIFLCLTSFVFAGGSGQGAAVHTLVIDPGHGGMDPGAIGPGGHHEADLALAVSLKFGEMVKNAFPDVKIIYTRTTDKFVSLADRADIANKAKADLFICIHLNSATNHEAYGTSTYVLGLHRTDDNLEIAKRENAVIELEGDKDKNYEFDPNSPEGHIIMSMKQNAFLDQSIVIASKIEDELAILSKRKSRGVKQAGFWVLYKTAMPSLLAEIGFISNPQEEQYLSTADGQGNIAHSIFNAFSSYKNQIEGKKDTPAPVAAVEKKTEAKADTAAPKADSKPLPTAAASEKKESKPIDTVKQAQADKPVETTKQATTQKPKEAVKVAEIVKPVEAAKPVDTPKPAETAKPAPQVIEKVATTTTRKTPAGKEVKTPAKDTKTVEVVLPQPNRTPDLDSTLIKMNEARRVHDSIVAAQAKANGLTPTRRDTAKILEASKIGLKTKDTLALAEAKPVGLRGDAKDKNTKATAATKAAAEAAKPKADTMVKTAAQAKPEPKPAKTETKTATAVKADTKPAAAPKEEPKTVKAEPAKEPKTTSASVMKPTAKESDNVTFNVQLIAAVRKPTNYKELVNTFGILHMEEIKDGVMRYMAGPFATNGEAEKALGLVKQLGYPDAFVVAYVNGKRTTTPKTQELAKLHP